MPDNLFIINTLIDIYMPSAHGYVSEEGEEYLEELVDKQAGVEDISDAIWFCVQYTAYNKENKDLAE